MNYKITEEDLLTILEILRSKRFDETCFKSSDPKPGDFVAVRNNEGDFWNARILSSVRGEHPNKLYISSQQEAWKQCIKNICLVGTNTNV